MPAKRKAASPAFSESDEDVDGAGFGDETRHFFEDDSEPDEIDTLTNSDGRLRLRPEIELEGAEYGGKKSTRKSAFDEESSDDGQDQQFEKEFSCFDASDEEDVPGAAANVGEGLDALTREYEELQEEERELLSNLRKQSGVDVHKGRAVHNQKVLWDKALETRISLQKLISGANQLPQTVASDATDIEEAYKSLKSAALQTMNSLMELENALVAQNEDIDNSNPPTTKQINNISLEGENANDAWERLSCNYTRLVPYRDQAVDRWHRKTQISTGAAASKTKLKAFNQSISQQVANAMKDPSRLIARILTNNIPKENDNTEDCTEMFDDTDFYQQLLREFLESDPQGRGDLELRKLRNKKRKLVDRRASKGRKIRYNIHEALVNFMTPEPMSLPPMATKLFGSLFGHVAASLSF